MRIADKRDERRRGKETDPGDGAQVADGRHCGGERGELVLDHADAPLELVNLLHDGSEHGTQHVGNGVLRQSRSSSTCGLLLPTA